MSILNRKVMSSDPNRRVFSADQYFNNQSPRPLINNQVNLLDNGGAVLIKNIDDESNHVILDSERAFSGTLPINDTADESGGGVSVAKNGFEVTTSSLDLNRFAAAGTSDYIAWSLRKKPDFFNVVSWTGNGVAGRTISHGLNDAPGMIVVKRVDAAGAWPVYHRSNTAAPETDVLFLNSTAATVDNNTYWNDTAPTSSVFSLGDNADVNANGGEYVAYVFGHEESAGGMIQCGSYVGNGAVSEPVISLGWEPDALIIKRSNGTSNWEAYDKTRGMGSGNENILFLNTTNAQGNASRVTLLTSQTGFKPQPDALEINATGGTYLYVAIRGENV